MQTALKIVTIAGLLVSVHGAPSARQNSVQTVATTNKTDFEAIFAAITAKYEASQNANLTPRDVNPPDPTFFSLEFGPTNGANNANGYMGFVSLDTYDVDACAQLCNTRGYDTSSGPCIYFNIWTAVVNDTETDIICSLYNTVTDASTATNTGQDPIEVTDSRGYARINALQDGSFQDFTCIQNATNSCTYAPFYGTFWDPLFIVDYDTVLIDNFPAHSGTSSAFFLFDTSQNRNNVSDRPATLVYSGPPLTTIVGQEYVISFFYTPNVIRRIPVSSNPLLSVYWNGVNVMDAFSPTSTPTTSETIVFYNGQVVVNATGNDTIVFHNGLADPQNIYLDDIAIFSKWF